MSCQIAILALAAPVFWTAAIMTLGVLEWDLFTIEVIQQPHFWEDPGAAMTWYLIPMIAGGFAGTAATMRLLRSQMLEVLRQDYVRTARAKGLRESRVVYLHALRNGLLPVVTIIGLLIARVFAGAVIVEQIFNIPGMGLWLVTAALQRDLLIVQAMILVIAVAIVIANLLTDISYGLLDPRIRYG